MKPYAGIGLRTKHYPEVLAGTAKSSWFEIISENYIDTEGRPLHVLEKVREDHRIGMHGVSLNIGSPDPVDLEYLKKLKNLVRRIQPSFLSDHLGWGGVEGRNWHDLLPVPMTQKMAKFIADKVHQVQDILGQRIALENISAYLRFQEDEMEEWEFISEVAERADCWLLLDVNNAYVNSFNHGFDPKTLIKNVPGHRVVQYHLAGHTNLETFLFDTHDAPIVDPVWDLFRTTISEIGPRPFIIERDDHIPPIEEVEKEAAKAEAIVEEVVRNHYGRKEESRNITLDHSV